MLSESSLTVMGPDIFSNCNSLTSQAFSDFLEQSGGLPCWLSGKESAWNAGDLGSIPGLGRSPGEGHGNPLQYPCLENPMDRGARQAAVHRVT